MKTRFHPKSHGRATFLWLTLGLLFATGSLNSQESGGGTVTGVVIDTWNTAPLAGVTVAVRGTTLAGTTDAEGRFGLTGVPAGMQILTFSKSGYARAVVTEVLVADGQNSTVDANLRPEFYELEEYVVTAAEMSEQTVQILEDRKNASSLTDAIGSDMFKNLAVGDAAEALSKVTGATVADGKYAVVRGLADRYTFTTLNGLELPSADPDRKAFQLDLMPSKFIEKVDVKKTFTPDMGGGFAGGSIDIVSRSFPEDFLFDFRMGTAYNTQSSLRNDFPMLDRSSTDWLGMDDGLRELPAAAAASNPSGSRPLPPEVGESFKSSQFAPIAGDSPMDAGMSLLVGDSQKVLGMKLGYLGGLNYKNEYRYYDGGFVRSYDHGGTEVKIDKQDARGVIDYQWGALANLSLELNEYHDLKFNFMYIQSASDEARRLQGQDGDVTSVEEGTYADQSILRWTERNLTYFQLLGEHEIPGLNSVKFDWGAAHSTTTQNDPDYRIFQFFADPENDYYNPEISAAQPSYPTRYWRDLEEGNDNLRGDVTVPLPAYTERENSIKTGVAYSASARDYAQRGFSVRRASSKHPFYSTGDPNVWMLPENLQFVSVRNFPVNLTYQGEQQIGGTYLMGDWNVLEWLEFTGGARYETTDITIDSFNVTKNSPGASGTIEQDDLLPSLTAVVRLRENVDLRAAWSQTVVRPTYREIADVAIYDVTQNRSYFGNPDLELSDSENLDLRASWYPRAGEILSASVFAKRITQPIEQASVTLDNTQITYENFDHADVVGFEGEIRLKLDRLTPHLAPVSIGLNGAYIQSEVPLTGEQMINRGKYGDFSTSRPLYNQPDYIVNADLTWDIERTGTTVTLSGGMVGRSLILVGLARPDEFVQTGPDLNLFVRQRLGKNWDMRFMAKNLLDPAFEVMQTWPGTGEVVLQRHTKGITFGLSAGCEF